jgi:sulfopyruvate decarboxylase TPP-binding subunit
VPDAGHSRLIEACQKSNSVRTLALDDRGGRHRDRRRRLAGRPALGAADAELGRRATPINLMGLTKTLRMPFLTLITMRGDYGEFNSWQYPMGQGTPKVLEAMGVLLYSVDKADEVKATVDAAARAAFNGGQSVAVLLRQKLIGIKDFGKKTA